MKHASKNRTLSRTRRGRTALLRGLAVSLIKNDTIKTTEAKAKELKPFADRLVTYGKENTVVARRRAASVLGQPDATVVKKLFEEVAPRFQERSGGYTRVIKVGRTAAGRDEAVIEFVK